jgi:hypothetical protein
MSAIPTISRCSQTSTPRRQATLAEHPFEGRKSCVFAGRIERFAQKQITRGKVGDGQWITLPAVAKLELALEVGTPQIVGQGAFRQRRAARAMARPAAALDQTMTIEHRMDGAFGRNPDMSGRTHR